MKFFPRKIPQQVRSQEKDRGKNKRKNITLRRDFMKPLTHSRVIHHEEPTQVTRPPPPSGTFSGVTKKQFTAFKAPFLAIFRFTELNWA